MQSITLHTRIDEHHQIILDVPKDLPIGEVEVTIRPVGASGIEGTAYDLTHEEMDRRLRAAGLLVEFSEDDPDWLELADVEELSEDELDRIGRLLVGDRPVEDLIREDRGEW